MLRPQFSPFDRFTGVIGQARGSRAGEVTSQIELKGAAGSRGETWKSAFGIIADYPLFGIGPEDLKMVFPRYETDLFRFKEAFHVKQDRCHNETFDVPVTKGLISFGVYLWLLFMLFSAGFKQVKGADAVQQLMIAGIMAAILAYLVQNQFSFGVVAITSLFWVLLAMVMVMGQGEEGATAKENFKLSAETIPWLRSRWSFFVRRGPDLFFLPLFPRDIYFKSRKNLPGNETAAAGGRGTGGSLSVLPFEGTTVSHLAITFLNMGNTGEALKI